MVTRSVFVLLLVLSALVLAAVPAPSPTTVGTDPCADPATERDAGFAPWHDLCAVRVAVTRPAGDREAPATLEVHVDVATTERLTPSTLELLWEADGCAHELTFGDATPHDDAFSLAGRDCGDEEEGAWECMGHVREPVRYGIVCSGDWVRAAIDPPTIDGDTYVWRLVLEGEVGEVLGTARPGAVLEDFQAVMSGRTDGSAPFGLIMFCSVDDEGEPEVCRSGGLDHLLGRDSFTVED